MSEIVNIKLSDELINRAKEEAEHQGRTLESVIAEWIERGASVDDISPLIPGAVYPIYTPWGNEAAAQALFEILLDV